MIDKLTASLLFAHSFKLVDKEGETTFTITGIMDDTFYLVDEESTPHYFRFDEAGVEFFVLCRPYSDLTKEVNGVVPIHALAELANEDIQGEVSYRSKGTTHGIRFMDSNGVMNVFCYAQTFGSFGTHSEIIDKKVFSTALFQELLFNKLYSLHFKPSSLPDECCRFIEG